MPIEETHDRAYLRSRIGEEIDRSRRYQRTFSLLVFEVVPVSDGIPIRKKLDRAMEVMRLKLRPSDVAARVYEDMAVVLLVETGRAGAKDALFRLRNRLLAASGSSWRVTLLTYPEDEAQIEGLSFLAAA